MTSLKKKTLKMLALAAGIPLLVGGCSREPHELLYEGIVNGQFVKYYNGYEDLFTYAPDKLEVYSSAGFVDPEDDGYILEEVFEDKDGSEIIGDHYRDKYVVVNGEKTKTYTVGYIIDDEGIKHRFRSDSDQISQAMEEVSKTKLGEVTIRYQDFKRKIELELGESLK